MNILHHQSRYWPWYFRVMSIFFRARFFATLIVIVASLAAQITKLLSSLLPIKVILLAGSEGVPRYFAFFIQPDQKAGWIIGLSIATVGFFIATSLLEKLLERLSQSVGGEIMESANEISVLSNQEGIASSYYLKLCNTSAYFIFALLALFFLYIINKNLFLFLSCILFFQLALSAWAISGSDDINPGRFKSQVLYGTSDYLTVLKTFNFLVGFFIILYPYLIGVDYNILFAIISMVLLRQTLNMLESLINNSAALSKASHRVNMLVFREFQLENKERTTSIALRDLFTLKKRERMAAQHLDSGNEECRIFSEWQDSTIPGAKTFKISKYDLSGSVSYYQQQVFPANRIPRIRNEEFLFSNISRDRLFAPELVATFTEGGFECQLFDYGSACAVNASQWKNVEEDIIAHMWSVTPPATLVDAYAASRPVLSKRLSHEFLTRVKVAVDSEEEKHVVESFLNTLPKLKKYLDSHPVYIRNPDIIQDNVVWGEELSRPLIMTWTRWHIDPIGAEIPKKMDDATLSEILKFAKNNRRDISYTLSVSDLRCINNCFLLERAIRAERYKDAINNMCVIYEVSMSLLKENMFLEVAQDKK